MVVEEEEEEEGDWSVTGHRLPLCVSSFSSLSPLLSSPPSWALSLSNLLSERLDGILWSHWRRLETRRFYGIESRSGLVDLPSAAGPGPGR